MNVSTFHKIIVLKVALANIFSSLVIAIEFIELSYPYSVLS